MVDVDLIWLKGRAFPSQALSQAAETTQTAHTSPYRLDGDWVTWNSGLQIIYPVILAACAKCCHVDSRVHSSALTCWLSFLLIGMWTCLVIKAHHTKDVRACWRGQERHLTTAGVEMRHAHVCTVVFLASQSGLHTLDTGLGMHRQSTRFMQPFSIVGQLFCCSILRVFCKGRKEKVIFIEPDSTYAIWKNFQLSSNLPPKFMK